ncbi:MAG: hypothetical protein ACFB2X_27060 [Rivularia sp. (in: cyanobacteria)]
MNIHPRSINHMGLTVTNLDEAVKWYQEVKIESLKTELDTWETIAANTDFS